MEISRFLLGLCGFIHFYSSVSAESTCKLKAKFNLNSYKDVEKKTVVIGGMFPIHKRIASSDGNTSKVPVSSGYEAVPNYRCGTGAPLAALVGAGGSDLSIATARILGLYHFPQVNSPGVIQRIVKTVIEATAKIIVVFSSDVDLSPLILELLRHNVTNRTWIASEAWVTSALINQPGVSSLLGGTLGFGVKRADIPGLQRRLLEIDPYADPLTEEFWETLFNCTLDYSKAVKQAKQRAMEENSTLSRAVTGVPDGLCTGKESLAQLNNTYSDVSQLRITYSVYKAVYAVAHALHNLEHCEKGKGPFNGNDCANITNFEPWQLMYYMKNVRFKVPHTGEEIYFDEGDVEGVYDIINWQFNSNGEISYVTVGRYNGSAAPENKMTIMNDSILWNNDIYQDWSNDAHDTCVPKIIEFLAFGEPLGITLIIISAFGALVTIAVGVVFVANIGTPLVKANDPLLSFSLLFSLVVTFLCSIVFLGEPQHWSCMTSQVALALGFALCLSSIMGKAAVLMMRARALKKARATAKAAAKAAKSGNPDVTVTNTLNNNDANACTNPEVDSLTCAHQRAIAAVATIIQAVACTVWLVILPPFPVENTSAQNIKIILECDQGSVVFICCIFAYDILLALLAFIFAFIARKLEDHFSEGKSVTFGMLVFFIVWISFVPAYLSTRGKFMVAVQIFAILASSFGLLTCIFLPKCYVLLVKPERNTEEMMRPRAKPRDGTSTGTSASLATAATEVNATIASTAIDD
ncbi:hypothetical protein FQN60_004746 [Etheostoma spectabile]|uniref:G-protein coupled receptors family 3 profile domain-containing protein n=1 Tax=Etheostoma spectabile TaxID=54343 RepID=A0A5J5DKR4_9PERO|nr:hypothetical protein FQN60_004746 [Etheostoma spectabile]